MTSEADVRRENAALKLRLGQLEEALRAVRGDEVDALYVGGAAGGQLYNRDGAELAYRQLIEEMGEGAMTLNAAGVVLYANRHFAELLGRPLEHLIGSRVATAFAPEARSELAALLARGDTGKCKAELDLQTDSGARVPVLLSVSQLGIDGLPGALCMVATDLTWQKRSEAANQARQVLLELVERQRETERDLQASLATLRLNERALGAISQGVLIADALGHTTYMNQACEDISGYSTQDMLGKSARMLQGPDTSPQEQRELHEAVALAHPYHGELLNYRKDGSTFWNELSVSPVFDAQGQLTQFVGVMRDVSARRLSEAQLLLSAKLFEQSSEGFIVTDAECRIAKVNQAFSTISGYSAAEAMGRNPSLLASGRHDASFFRDMFAETERSGCWQGEVWNRHKDGSLQQVWMTMSRVTDETGRTSNYVAAFNDITQRKEAEEKVRRLAHYDPLTGLPNRALLNDRALQALQMSKRSREPMALLFMDLDHFKSINDSLGHDIGDRLLVAVAKRFSAALRDRDTFSRTGGDEFVLLLPGTDASGAAHVAQKLLHLATEAYVIEQHELTITPSIGIALYPADGADFGELAKCADAAMYCAKQAGRNTSRFHTAQIQAQSARLLLLENALRRALERDQLQLRYQPQKSLSDGAVIGVEALLRWHHPELGWVSPAEFIPIAEGSGLIAPIGEWVLRTALRQMRAWTDAGMTPITMAVNLSAVQFRQQGFPELVSEILAETGVGAHWLELELTERVGSEDPLAAIAMMNQLHASGVRMSIDDFGTGYSSLNYLKQFKVYKLKIDQSFVRSVIEDADDRAIVSAIIHLAESLGLRTIAEGVETESQMHYLRAQGCDEIQGYWFGRPMSALEFEAFMGARSDPESLGLGEASRRPVAAAASRPSMCETPEA